MMMRNRSNSPAVQTIPDPAGGFHVGRALSRELTRPSFASSFASVPSPIYCLFRASHDCPDTRQSPATGRYERRLHLAIAAFVPDTFTDILASGLGCKTPTRIMQR